MRNFAYTRADDAATAIAMVSRSPGAKYLGGGTNLVDLMRENIEQPDALVDVTHLSHRIEELGDGGIRIGAAAKPTATLHPRPAPPGDPGARAGGSTSLRADQIRSLPERRFL